MPRTEKEKTARRIYEAEHREEIREQRRKWAEKNADRIREVSRMRREQNTDIIREQQRSWRERNADKKHADGRRWHRENPERSKANLERWKKENAEQVKKKKAEYRADPEKRKLEQASAQKWREENREKLREDARQYRQLPEVKLQRAIWQRERDALKAGSGGKVTPAEIEELWKKQDGKCVFFMTCGSTLDEGKRRQWHVDHIDPLRPKDKSRAPGRHVIDNLQLLCGACNISKHASDPYTFAQQNGLLFCDIVDVAKPKRARKKKA